MINAPQASLWLSGGHPGGAGFMVGEDVSIEQGPCAGRSAAIVTLAELEPEPVYLVETAQGHYLQVPQSWLRRSG